METPEAYSYPYLTIKKGAWEGHLMAFLEAGPDAGIARLAAE